MQKQTSFSIKKKQTSYPFVQIKAFLFSVVFIGIWILNGPILVHNLFKPLGLSGTGTVVEENIAGT